MVILMIHIPFLELNNTVFALYDISSIELIPQNTFLSHVKNGRILNGFLYMLDGECLYSFNGETINIYPGMLIYLPKGSRHTYTALTKNIKYIRIDFRMLDVNSSEEIILTKYPYVIYDRSPLYVNSLIRQLTDIFMSHAYCTELKSKAVLYNILSHICSDINNNTCSVHDSKIINATNYIENNLTKDISSEFLAELCNLSPSHFRRIFKQCKGYTPTEYKNILRIEKAKKMLNNQCINISEIADLLGFESIYYFSRVFKKVVGISPKEYRKL